MKRFLILLILCLVVFLSQAQTGHLKFSGIAIDGTITQFQSKLMSKGYVINKDLNSALPVGCRAFSGTFVGNNVYVIVYYDEDTKVVYRTKVVLSGISEDMADQKFFILKICFCVNMLMIFMKN